MFSTFETSQSLTSSAAIEGCGPEGIPANIDDMSMTPLTSQREISEMVMFEFSNIDDISMMLLVTHVLLGAMTPLAALSLTSPSYI